MTDQFELAAPQKAREFLHNFDPGASRKGAAAFRQGRVSHLTSAMGGTELSANVQGRELYDVDLLYTPDEGWWGNCTCPLESHCKHLYAAMQAALAEHSIAAVRGLSAGPPARPASAQRPSTGGRNEGEARASNEPTIPFFEQVAGALKRPLAPHEKKLLAKINEVYRRSVARRSISRWDFDEMGLSLGGYGWDTLQIWPSFPRSEREFWLYVANALLEHRRVIPEFLKPVTDLSLIQENLRQWRREMEVERWKQMLTNSDFSQAGTAGSPRMPDFRLVVQSQAAALHWKDSGETEFEDLKVTRARQLSDDYGSGKIVLSAEAGLLWEAFHQRTLLGRSMSLPYNEAEAQAVLSRLLRTRLLDGSIVSEVGLPLERPAEPLRWELSPAASADEDYKFRIVRSDGGPVDSLVCSLHGNPTLYLTASAVFTGPPCPLSVLKPHAENTIPAPAIETAGGLGFLQSLGLAVPSRLQERVRRVAMQVAVSCELKPIYPDSPTENCTFSVVAESADGARTEMWNGNAWCATPPSPHRLKSTPDDGVITLYDRSLLAELPRLFEPLGLKHDNYARRLAMRVTKKFPEVFLPWLKSLPPEITVRLHGELATLAQEAVSGQVRLDVSEAAIDWFDLRVVLDVSDTTLTAAEIKLLLNAKGGFVRLEKKGWRRLAFNLSEGDDEKLARLGLTPHELTAEPQRLHALQLADPAARKFLPEEQVEQVQRRASEIKARVTPDLPAGVTAQLRPYQLEGFHFLAYLTANHFGGILADDMGLGKTLQTLAWLQWLIEPPTGSPASLPAEEVQAPNGTPDQRVATVRTVPSLVVCPKSVMDNWRAEAERFTPSLRVKLWTSGELETFLDRVSEADLHVLNYSQLRIIGESLAPVQWRAVILDEGQYIKNPNSQTAQIARALRSQHRLVLSGTPIENRLLDLWSLMAFAMPGVLGSRHHFAKIFDGKEDPFARRRLASRVRPFLLRRTKSQVAKDLPDRIEEDLFCQIEGEQKTLYRAELKRAQQLLLKVQTQKQLAKERFHFLTSLLRLRQICCHPKLVKPDSRAESAKLEALLEQIEPLMEEGHKVLVFSQFVEMLALLKPPIQERGWPMFYLAGETENRGELVQKFQSAEGAAVFLISLKAGGFGLNLTAASYVVLFDPWWNPAVESQAIDRTHRIGQNNKVIAYRLLIKDSIEQKIRSLQKQKSALAEDVLGEEKFAQSLTLNDLQFLFAD